MPAYVIIRQDSYHDSVLLMRISRELQDQDGIADAVVAMGTPHNQELLAELGYPQDELAAAGPNDLIIAVRAEDVPPETCSELVEGLLAATRAPAAVDELRPYGLGGALDVAPDVNLALISVPGQYAAREARRALARGLHVMLFSDNVALGDEVALKAEAAERGLLCMGPDCGTAIINGKPLAFANVVRRGTIGVVGASGTGIQEVTCCIHRLGGGISQAIGTGGRDLSARIGGTMTRLGVRALAQDSRTRLLLVVSKTPSPTVARLMIDELVRTGKPAVVHFVGAPTTAPVGEGRIVFADSLAEAAALACQAVGCAVPASALPDSLDQQLAELAGKLAPALPPAARLCGLFCGGTLGQEALVLLERTGLTVHSNLHQDRRRRIEGATAVPGHVVLDLGDDVFTAGRPHPMIDPLLRNERLALEMESPGVDLLLCDVLLGYGSHPDPAGILAQGVNEARRRAEAAGRSLVTLASVTGTETDPQNYDEQKRRLQKVGVVVLPDNRSAVVLAASLLGRAG